MGPDPDKLSTAETSGRLPTSVVLNFSPFIQSNINLHQRGTSVYFMLVWQVPDIRVDLSDSNDSDPSEASDSDSVVSFEQVIID